MRSKRYEVQYVDLDGEVVFDEIEWRGRERDLRVRLAKQGAARVQVRDLGLEQVRVRH